MPSLWSNLKRKNLKKQRANLIEEYEVTNNQLGHTLDDVQRLRLQRRVKSLEREIEQIDNKVRQLPATGPSQNGKEQRFSKRRLWVFSGSTLILIVSAVFLAIAQGWIWSQTSEVCNNPLSAREVDAFKVYVASFERNSETASSNPYLADQLFDKLTRQAKDKIIICRVEQVIGNSFEARSRGKTLGATIVIWGRQSPEIFEIGLEVIDWPPQGQVFTQNLSDQESNVVSETEILLELVVLKTNSTLSEIYYLDDQLGKARRILTVALAEATRQKLDIDKPEELAEDYWFLGSLLQIPPEPNYEQALEAYDKAIALDNTLDVALFNKGDVYELMEEPDLAITTYTQLIEANPAMKRLALGSRARLFAQQANREAAEQDLEELIKLDPLAGYQARSEIRLEIWGDIQGAIADFKELVNREPDNPDHYHNLGYNQLQLGQIEEAKQTYQNALPYLDKESRAYILEDLELLAQDKPELAQTVEVIRATVMASAP